MTNNREYRIEILDHNGINNGLLFNRNIDGRDIKSKVSFTSQVNGGQGDINITVHQPFESEIIKNGQILRIYCYRKDIQKEYLLYAGRVIRIERYMHTEYEEISIGCVGIHSYMDIEMPKTYFPIAGQTGPVFASTANTLSTLVGGILTSGPAIVGLPYDEVIYGTYQPSTMRGAFDQLVLATPGTYWICGSDGVVSMILTGSTITPPIHVFSITKISNLQHTIDSSKIVSYVRVTSGSFVGLATNPNSGYGAIPYIVDIVGLSQAQCDAYAQKFLDNKSILNEGIEFTVENDYPLETIQPGQWCSIVDRYTGNKYVLFIQHIEYIEHSVIIRSARGTESTLYRDNYIQSLLK